MFLFVLSLFTSINIVKRPVRFLSASMKFVVSALISTAAVVLAAPVPDPVSPAVPLPWNQLTVYVQPGIPTEAAARTQLAGLTVSEPTNEDTYDRDLFPHWSGVSGNCNAR